MGNMIDVSAGDFHWSYSDEPHATRRKEILQKYPQVKELYGHDPNAKYFVAGCVFLQLGVAILMKDYPFWLLTVLAYAFGGFIAHSLFLAMHEISHGLLFQSPVSNKLFGCFANSATAIPHFSMFQRYHMEHHQFQGVDKWDVDVPTRLEATIFSSRLLKALFVFLQPVAYAVRPLIVKPKQPGKWEAINWSTCLIVNAALVYFFGYKPVAYMVLSGVLGSGLHPVAGHFIAEHYVFVPGQETYSYYGPLNWLCFNVGYHNEHHDFPRVPGSRLPQLKKIAPEYYDNLPCYNSWTKVLWDFINNPNVTLFSRMKRQGNKLTRKAD
eukprot:TRINITY_DN31365_c0_g1_i1.p1 TRINITY_DN31365_c0_g1~~TRINITY_DN31365_c0_g1_i1.p1  ORF type:complete len:325 (-),score=60.36 TRINITY_DN31365_c0_g1_i1:176-1150(-)